MNSNKILTALAILCTLVASVFAATTFFALASDLQATNQRLDYKIAGDAILDIEKRIFIIETRHNINVPGKTPIPMATDVLEDYHKLKKQLKCLYMEQGATLKGN